MGIGGKFWDVLKPYARHEGFDFIRDKRVAVDLSFWIVQHETAIKAHVRNPHIRLTFFRTINLFSKFGAFPVFVVDGTPSPLKSRARIARFFQLSGIDVSSLPVVEEGVSVERNQVFMKCVQDCVELIELLGMPILKARGEAEALCAQLNSEGHVDACITADSDAFLYGAKCVIKGLQPNSKEPFECYLMSDIEAGLGLKRKHLIAISLLVGSDHDLNGVQGIGTDTALRFVQSFSENEILDRLHDIGNGNMPPLPPLQGVTTGGLTPTSAGSSKKTKFPHCSICGHPGSKRDHSKFACEYCSRSVTNGCLEKPMGFKCNCFSCDTYRKENEQKKRDIWQVRVCKKIAMERNFPNDEIIELYLRNNHGYFTVNDGPCLFWESPKTEMLIDFLVYRQLWEPSYIRQRMLPMLSTIFLRELASNQTENLLYGQYEFDSIQRVKVRLGHEFYVVKWKKAACGIDHTISNREYDFQEEFCTQQEEVFDVDESIDSLDGPSVPSIQVNDGCQLLLTDENMKLVQAAFPKEVERYLQEKELKMSKKRKKPILISEATHEKSESTKSKCVQLSITEFYRSTKVLNQAKPGEDLPKNSSNLGSGASKERRKVSSPNLSKSVRRRLLFD